MSHALKKRIWVRNVLMVITNIHTHKVCSRDLHLSSCSSVWCFVFLYRTPMTLEPNPSSERLIAFKACVCLQTLTCVLSALIALAALLILSQCQLFSIFSGKWPTERLIFFSKTHSSLSSRPLNTAKTVTSVQFKYAITCLLKGDVWDTEFK